VRQPTVPWHTRLPARLSKSQEPQKVSQKTASSVEGNAFENVVVEVEAGPPEACENMRRRLFAGGSAEVIQKPGPMLLPVDETELLEPIELPEPCVTIVGNSDNLAGDAPFDREQSVDSGAVGTHPLPSGRDPFATPSSPSMHQYHGLRTPMTPPGSMLSPRRGVRPPMTPTGPVMQVPPPLSPANGCSAVSLHGTPIGSFRDVFGVRQNGIYSTGTPVATTHLGGQFPVDSIYKSDATTALGSSMRELTTGTTALGTEVPSPYPTRILNNLSSRGCSVNSLATPAVPMLYSVD